jgi:hypothetical protein
LTIGEDFEVELMSDRKAQTATEYMIILAVVIIIALIVVGVLGGIPGIGTGARGRAASAYWASSNIAIPSFSMVTGAAGTSEHTLVIRNNFKGAIKITVINLSTSGSGTANNFSLAPNNVTVGSTTGVVLGPGESKTFRNRTAFAICTTAGNSFTSNVRIKYVDEDTGATYIFTGDGNQLTGVCAN